MGAILLTDHRTFCFCLFVCFIRKTQGASEEEKDKKHLRILRKTPKKLDFPSVSKAQNFLGTSPSKLILFFLFLSFLLTFFNGRKPM